MYAHVPNTFHQKSLHVLLHWTEGTRRVHEDHLEARDSRGISFVQIATRCQTQTFNAECAGP